MERTRVRVVNGMLGAENRIKPVPITVRLTVDAIGKSLSLASDDIGVMFMIPLETIADWIEVKNNG